MGKALALLILQLISVLQQTNWISAANLPDTGCHFEPMKDKFVSSKDIISDLEEEEILKEALGNTKQECQEQCQSDCKGFALVGSVENPSNQYDGCYQFTEDLEHLISTKKLTLFTKTDSAFASDDVLTLFDRICDDENKIGGGGGGAGGAGGLPSAAVSNTWKISALTTALLAALHRF